MIYTHEKTGFSFELPEGWRGDKHNLTITFYGPEGGLGIMNHLIQLKIATILPVYVNPEDREKFMSEPGVQVFRRKLGKENNVVVLKKEAYSEISAVREGIHYSISHSNDRATIAAVDKLCKTALFKSNSSIEKQKIDASNTLQRNLLYEIDTGGIASQKAEDAFVELGEAAVDDILQSVAEINGRMNGSIPDRNLDPPKEMARLERRARVMERIRHPFFLKALFDALADSAIAISSYKQQRNIAYEVGEINSQYFLKEYINSARSLNKASIKALVAYGDMVIPHARRHMSSSNTVVKKSLKKVIGQLEHKWWKVWK